MKNVEIFGIPGSGKSSAIKNAIRLRPRSYVYDFKSLAISKASKKIKAIYTLAELIPFYQGKLDHFIYSSKVLSLESRTPESFYLFLDLISDLRLQGFIPNYFWMNRMLIAISLKDLARQMPGVLFCDESISQRLLNVLIRIPRFEPTEALYELMKNDQMLLFETSLEVATQRALDRDKGRREASLTVDWVREHYEALSKAESIMSSMSLNVIKFESGNNKRCEDIASRILVLTMGDN